MPSHHSELVAVSDVGYTDDLVSLSSSLPGLQFKADIMSAFALLFDLTISAPKLRAACLGPVPPTPSLTIHGPGWTPTIIPVRTVGTIHAGTEHESPSHPSVHHPRVSKGDGHSSPCCLHQHDGQGGIYRPVPPMDISGSPSLGRPSQPSLPTPAPTPPDAPQRSPLHAPYRGGPGAPTPLRPIQPSEMVDGLPAT